MLFSSVRPQSLWRVCCFIPWPSQSCVLSAQEDKNIQARIIPATKSIFSGPWKEFLFAIVECWGRPHKAHGHYFLSMNALLSRAQQLLKDVYWLWKNFQIAAKPSSRCLLSVKDSSQKGWVSQWSDETRQKVKVCEARVRALNAPLWKRAVLPSGHDPRQSQLPRVCLPVNRTQHKRFPHQ